MDRNLFLCALRARFWVFATALIITVGVASAVSLWLPKTYKGTATLVVDNRDEQSLSGGFNAVASAQERMGYLQTQVDIITNEKVARMVVENLRLADQPRAKAEYAELTDGGEGPGTIEDWLTGQLMEGVEVSTSQSSVIHITFYAGDPAFAATAANAFANAYMETMLQLRVEPTKRAAVWFDEQIETLRTSLEAEQAKLTAYQQKNGIVSANEEMDIEHTRFAELSMQLLRVQEQTMLLNSRARQARRALELGTPLEYLPDEQVAGRVRELRGELLVGEAALKRISTQFGANHPDYRRQLAENTSRREALESEKRAIVGMTENLQRENQQQVVELQAALDAQRDRLLNINEVRDELSVLVGNVRTAQSAYDTAMQRHVINQVDSRASQTNIALLNAAVAPALPYRPNIPLNIGLSLVVGLMLGAGLVVFLEMSNRPVRLVTDLEGGEHIPLLGALDAWVPPRKSFPLLPAPAGTSAISEPA